MSLILLVCGKRGLFTDFIKVTWIPYTVDWIGGLTCITKFICSTKEFNLVITMELETIMIS